ncbi:branched-chain amino acid aminotransferase [Actinokineospora iranica]|uniref:branched-chain-amino-acid transaminase n=1 Tax=Actinokineospora iranica TaxID=1271860 RepID=A0A1G6Z1R4_9PSEU|nr:branched-chain amino acid aminotransferase [Actinokineospora iranica]SDD96472.1 branched-chain amino acid aminotransferase [Actinokineospora iranica]
MSVEFVVHPSDHPLAAAERAAILAAPGFGKHFTDHMATATWTPDTGWRDRRVSALAPFSLHPSAAVLHYAQEIFEGLKAYRHADGGVWLFRPEMNARRFARSARRLAMPELDEESFVRGVEALVRADEAWVPDGGSEHSLYLRPFMFAAEAFLGVRPAEEFVFSVIASPAGPYFAAGVAGVTLWISAEYTRAAPGGTGAAKCGGNYAGSLAAQREAREHGCDQVLYLDSADRNKLEESGTMNLCLITATGELITPGLGTILDGVTRDSVLALAPDHNLTPVERPVTRAELSEGCRTGAITEVFATGTAAVITPITAFRSPTDDFTVGDGAPGKTTLTLREHILDIQYGRTQDTRGWLHRVL